MSLFSSTHDFHHVHKPERGQTYSTHEMVKKRNHTLKTSAFHALILRHELQKQPMGIQELKVEERTRLVFSVVAAKN